MKNKQSAGFSLVEVLIAIVVLGILAVPACTSLVMAVRINTRTQDMMQAQLAVSSAVETLMAEGIPEAETPEEIEKRAKDYQARFPDVTVSVGEAETGCYPVTVTSTDISGVTVDTFIREALPTEPEQPAETGEGEGTQ